MINAVELSVGDRNTVANGRGCQTFALFERAVKYFRIDDAACRHRLLGKEVRHFGQYVTLRRARQRGDNGLG